MTHANDVIRKYQNVVPTLQARMGTGGNQIPLVVRPYCIGNGQLDQLYLKDVVGTLNCMHDQQCIYTRGTDSEITIRRLTETEVERLQMYPDGWTNIGIWVDSSGKKHKPAKSVRYKALGNSICLPFWEWLIERIHDDANSNITMGSLFDGIGGFPFCWEKTNGIGTARWASEIDEFAIAVTKYHFASE